MGQLGNDELSYIFKKLENPDDKKSFSQVSKRFLKIACFGLLDLRISSPEMLTDILPVSPNMGTFYFSKQLSNTHLNLLAQSCPKLWNLQLSLPKNVVVPDPNEFEFDFNDEGLCVVANACTRLLAVKLSKRLYVGDVGVVSVVRSCKNLIHLDLEKCVNVTDVSLKAIGLEASCLGFLGLRGCRLITDLGLEYLSKGGLGNRLERLILAECDMISDKGVSYLKEMDALWELNLSKCGVNVTDFGIVSLVSQIPNIEILDLSWLVNVTDVSLCEIASECLQLDMLSLRGCEAITRGGLLAFADHENLREVELFSCDNIYLEDVEFFTSVCPCVQYVGLSSSIKNIEMTMSEKSTIRYIGACEIGWE